jgi:hypothetical protein
MRSSPKALAIVVTASCALSSLPALAAEPIPLKGGFPEGLPGYTMRPGGQLDIEVPLKKRIYECVEKGLGSKIVWEAYPTKRVLQMLMDNKLDLAFPMGFTAERAAKMKQSTHTWGNADYLLSNRAIDPNDKLLRIAARLGSPQHVDYVAEGYTRVAPAQTYEELIKTLALNHTDVVIIPQSVYEDQKADWPKDVVITVGRTRNTGFYLNTDDPKKLAEPLNLAIERCRKTVK